GRSGMSGGNFHLWRPAHSAWSIAAALILAAGALPLAASAAPKISVPAPQREVGELTAGDVAEVAFPVSNAGTELLKIQSVQVTCGCTTVSYPESLQPGEK